MKINFLKAHMARRAITRPYIRPNLKPIEQTLISRYNASRGGAFNTEDLKNAAYGNASSIAQSEYSERCSALETLTAYLAGKWGKLQLAQGQLMQERDHLKTQREDAFREQFNSFNEYDSDGFFVRLLRAIGPFLGMLLIIGISTVLDYAINSSRVTIINNSRLSTMLLTQNDLLLSNLSVVAISLVNNLAPFIAGIAWQRKARGRTPASTTVFIVSAILIAFLVNAIIPIEMYSLPNATAMQKLMSLLPYATSTLGFLLPILVAKDHARTVEECDAALTHLNKRIGAVQEKIRRIEGEKQTAESRVQNDLVATQKSYFAAIDTLFCRFVVGPAAPRRRTAANSNWRALPEQSEITSTTTSSFPKPPAPRVPQS